MKQITLTMDVPDEFEPGDCLSCPIHYEQDYFDEDDGWDFDIRCPLYRDSEECPLEESKEYYHPVFGKMRDATLEEQQGVTEYIHSIATDTGIKFDDIK